MTVARAEDRANQLHNVRVLWPKIIIAVVTLVYALVLHLSYVNFIAPVYGYLGYGYRVPDTVRYAVVVALVAILAMLMPQKLDRPSVAVLWIQFIVAAAPTMLVLQISPAVPVGTAFGFALGVAVVWAAVIFLTSDRVRPRMRLHLRPRQGGVHLWLPSLVVASLLMDLLLFVLGGLHVRLVSLLEVADVRLDYRQLIGSAPSGVAYLLLGVSNVVNPVLIVSGLQRRSAVPVVVGVFGQIAVYSLTGYKTTILSVPLMFVVWFWLHLRKGRNASWFQYGTTGLILIAYVLFAAFDKTTLMLLFVLRFIVAQGNLVAGYITFFHDRPPVYWSYSFMGWAIHYPYIQTPNFLVGSVVRGSADVSANVNIFGDGFMNMRWPGIMLEALLLVIILWLLDAAAQNVSLALAAAVVIVPSFDLANTSIFTAFTTHGLLIAIIVLATAPRIDAPEPDTEFGPSRRLKPNR